MLVTTNLIESEIVRRDLRLSCVEWCDWVPLQPFLSGATSAGAVSVQDVA